MITPQHPHSTRRTFILGAVIASLASLAPIAATQAQARGYDDDDRDRDGSRGAVYTASNAVAGNQILAYVRDSRGRLQPAGQFATGGTGTGTGLGNQGGLELSDDGRWLLAVNAGSSELSLFAVTGFGLRLVDRVPSGGQRPISVTMAGDLVYVLNAGGAVTGGSDNITGFRIGRYGKLTPLAGSTRPLSVANAGPAQISFNNDGDLLAVTEKATQTISTFTLKGDGTTDVQRAFTSSSPTPFGFAFGYHDQVIVSEAVGGAAGAGVMSAYDLGSNGLVSVLDPSVPTKQSAPCWVVITRDGRFAYTSNTGSASITGYAVNRAGKLGLLNVDGVTATTGAGPIDLALTAGSRFLYSLNSRDNSLSAFEVQSNGGLVPVATVTGLPAGANGLIAR
ncbi:MAG: beta-propeller fold lactonase family protein [Chthoniobacteraceae bacterium]